MNEHTNEQPERERTPTLSPRIWVGSLADYNAGHLHGDWLDAAVEDDELVDAVQRILATSREPNAEEWGIFDYDNFGAYKPDEYEDLATVAAIARGIEEHGFAFATWAAVSDTHIDDLSIEFEDAFLGHFDSKELFVDSVLEDFDVEATLERELPSWLQPHVRIDREGIASDMQISGELILEDAPEGGIYVFRR